MLKQLSEYFGKKGHILTATEYKAATDAPMRFMIAKRPFGSWGRMKQMCEVNFPDMFVQNEVAPTAAKATPKKVEKEAKK